MIYGVVSYVRPCACLKTVYHSVFFSVLVVRLPFGVALCVLVEMFLLEMKKTYQSIRLNILVMTREITEGNNFQEYNKEYRAKRERVIFFN